MEKCKNLKLVQIKVHIIVLFVNYDYQKSEKYTFLLSKNFKFPILNNEIYQ